MTIAANPLRGEAVLVVGVHSKILVFDVNAICLVESALDTSIYDLLAKLQGDNLSIHEARALLWAGLSRHHACSLAEAGDVMSDAGLLPVTIALLSGVVAAFGIATEGKDVANPPTTGMAATG